jgi:hypothetical protein
MVCRRSTFALPGQMMDLPGSAFLYTVATLAMTFVGFCAVVLVLRQARAEKATDLQLMHSHGYIEVALSAVAIAILPPLLAVCGLSELRTWQWSSATNCSRTNRLYGVYSKCVLQAISWENPYLRLDQSACHSPSDIVVDWKCVWCTQPAEYWTHCYCCNLAPRYGRYDIFLFIRGTFLGDIAQCRSHAHYCPLLPLLT